MPTPTAVPTQTPAAVTPIDIARGLSDGTTVTVEGVLTTDLGALEGGRTAFVQDATGGIALYLDTAVAGGGVGTWIRVTGTTDSRFSQRTIRVAAAGIVAIGPAPLPVPLAVATGAVGEDLEGLRVAVTGTVVEAPSALADGTGLLIDDGSGSVRIVVTPVALGGLAVARDAVVSVTGPVGQRDSTGAGTTGYRVFATLQGEISIVPVPSPSPSPATSPAPTPAPTGAPSPSGSPTASRTPSASPSPAQTAVPTPV
ncbi:MAG TPA: hypothetical protein VK656_06985, partial [Candidatus Acidoferrum sp.]|nr:hypothetical protein [Candidatus Acidoferrum sp.]